MASSPEIHPSLADAEEAVRTLLRFIGEDPGRAGLHETPKRVVLAWLNEWGRGYFEEPQQLVKLFPDPSIGSQMVAQRGIRVVSHCEHHMAPFYGVAHVAYIIDPERGAIGLSKLSRVVNHFARRLQVQERLTGQIADFLLAKVSPLGVGVIIRAQHMCMLSRGVQEHETETITSALRGAFFDNATTRSEFMMLASGS